MLGMFRNYSLSWSISQINKRFFSMWEHWRLSRRKWRSKKKIPNSSYIFFSVCKVASQNLNKKQFGRDWRKPTIQAAQGGKGRGRKGQHDAMIARFSYNIAFLEALSGIVAIIANGIDNQESTKGSFAPDWVGCRNIGALSLSFRHSAKASTKVLNPCSEAQKSESM